MTLKKAIRDKLTPPAERIELLLEGARILQAVIDPLPLPGRIRTRPFGGERSNRVDALWALEAPTLEEAQELWATYRGKQLHDSITKVT